MKTPSAVVDTNIIISALILPKSKPAKILFYLRHQRFILITSQPLLYELETVLARPKYENRYHISQIIRKQTLKYYRSHARMVSKLQKPDIIIRDKKDLIVLATALDGGADYLVTGDNDLLELINDPKLTKCSIVTADNFLKLLDKENRL